MEQKWSQLLKLPAMWQELVANDSQAKEQVFDPCCPAVDRMSVKYSEELGDGAHGEVLDAQIMVNDSTHATPCALKVPKRHSKLSSGLLPEAIMTSRIHRAAPNGRHPHVVRNIAILTRNEAPDTATCLPGAVASPRVDAIAMERYPATLEALLSKRPLSMRAIYRILSQILCALVSAKAVDVAHGDVKPDNIFIKPGGKDIVLGDFGSAYCRGVTSAAPRGTPAFSPPEAFAPPPSPRPGGPPPRPSDDAYDCFAADVWAFGMVLLFAALPRTMAVLYHEDEVFATGEAFTTPNSLAVRVIAYLKTVMADPTMPLHNEAFAEILRIVFVEDPAQRGTLEQLQPLVAAGAAADAAARGAAGRSADGDGMTARDMAWVAQDAALAARVRRQLQEGEGAATDPLASLPSSAAAAPALRPTAATAAAPAQSESTTCIPPIDVAQVMQPSSTEGAVASCRIAQHTAQHAEHAAANNGASVAERSPAVCATPATPACAAGPAAAANAEDLCTPGAHLQPPSLTATPDSGKSTRTTELRFTFAANSQSPSASAGSGPEEGPQVEASGCGRHEHGALAEGECLKTTEATDITQQTEQQKEYGSDESPVLPATVCSRIRQAMAAARPANLKCVRRSTDEAPPAPKRPRGGPCGSPCGSTQSPSASNAATRTAAERRKRGRVCDAGVAADCEGKRRC